MKMMITRTVRVLTTLGMSAGTAALISCGDQVNQQVWTTKNQSMLGVKTDAPSLNVSDQLMAAGSAATATELRGAAMSILLQATESPNPQLRANSIEALLHSPDQLDSVLQRALGDENRGVRFVAAMTAGKLKLLNLIPLLEPLRHDESQSVQAAALYALKRCGRPVDLNPLAAMLTSEDPEVKGNAVFVLGELGDRTAVALLRNTAGKGLEGGRRKVVELQLAEALVKLGSHKELTVIRAALYAPAQEAEISALACQMCGELRDDAALGDLTNIANRTGYSQRPPEIRMAAALAVARIDQNRAMADVPAAFVTAARPEHRAQAAHTLGAMRAGGKGSMVALSHLSHLMSDPNPLVQVAAAGGILQMQPPAYH